MKSYIKKVPCCILLLLLLAPVVCLTQGIEIQSGGSIVNTGATTIEIVNGGFINNGTYTKGAETITMSGTAASEISGSQISDFNNLVITNMGGVSIVHDAKVTVSNSLYIGSGANLTILGNAMGTGSLIINGTLSNSGTIISERYMPGIAEAWHMLSSPMNGMAISTSDFEPGTEDDFYAWNEPSPGTWVNYKNNTTSPTFTEINGGDNFAAGKGYLVAYNEINPEKTFSGTLNYGSVNFTLKNTGVLRDWIYVSGWNLIGNPYSSAIDWNLVNRTQFLDEFAYIYDPNKAGGEGYVPIDGSSANANIAANQGFFVIADLAAHNQIFTFTNTVQTHNGDSYLKSESTDEQITLRLSSASYFDEAIIRIRNGSSFYRDREDALKIYSFNIEIPQLFSQSLDDVRLSVNSLPSVNAETNIALGMLIPSTSSYYLSIESVSEYLANNSVLLEDKLLGSWHKLTESSYEFNAETGEIADRFVLHFGVVGIDESTSIVTEEPKVWQNAGQLFIQSKNDIQKLEIFDLQGRKLVSREIEGNNASIPLNLPTGIFLVRVQNSTTKIVISSY
ncbi:MAG TPA: T9SS type A sorting domain-containing protein [Bacteroidales bacterium]